MTIVHNQTQNTQRSTSWVVSESTYDQTETETECEPYFVDISSLPRHRKQELYDIGLVDPDTDDLCLLYEKHVAYLRQIWAADTHPLKAGFASLDASRTWMIYWCLQAVDLLESEADHLIDAEENLRMVQTIESCFAEEPVQDEAILKQLQQDEYYERHIRGSNQRSTTLGGFGGGPGQLPHAATTYASVLALAILSGRCNSSPKESNSALQLLQRVRAPLYVWMTTRLHNHDTGSFRMQDDGEVDVRATYCVVSVARLLHILSPRLAGKAAAYVALCQSAWDGGFGAEPFAEAHGGYTFCAVAAIQILDDWDFIDVTALMHWLVSRQMPYEGGFNGRSNKLVDGCYSFWQGSAMAIVTSHLNSWDQREGTVPGKDAWLRIDCNEAANARAIPLLFDVGMLQRYVLLCAQGIQGGMRDKPSKTRDFYHSCYVLSGLSVAQHCGGMEFGHKKRSRVQASHPVYNIRPAYARLILDHFGTTEKTGPPE